MDRDSHPGVTILTLNRPDKLNAMTVDLVTELYDGLSAVATDRDCRVIVLTGAGRGFCAGLDLGGYGEVPGTEVGAAETGFATQTHIARLVERFRSVPQPVVAAINGAAAGGGLAIALASDVRIASASARFNVAFVRLRAFRMRHRRQLDAPRLIGASAAWEMMLTGRLIDAAEAERIGLVLKVVPDGEVLESALETADLIASNSPWGVRMTKEVMWAQLEVGSLHAGIDLENRTQVLSSMTGDMGEAVRAFMEKRPPSIRQLGWAVRPAAETSRVVQVCAGTDRAEARGVRPVTRDLGVEIQPADPRTSRHRLFSQEIQRNDPADFELEPRPGPSRTAPWSSSGRSRRLAHPTPRASGEAFSARRECRPPRRGGRARPRIGRRRSGGRLIRSGKVPGRGHSSIPGQAGMLPSAAFP